MSAEEEARDNALGKEVTIVEIYRALASKIDISQKDCETILNLELETERDYLAPVPGAEKLVIDARRFTSRILFVSDMYLPSNFIREQLERYGFYQNGDGIYVSAEWKASKALGDLFTLILEKESLNAPDLTHTGDRHDADCLVPSQFGIKTNHLNVCRLSRYEQMLEDYANDSNGFTSLLAGVSRITRLRAKTRDLHLNILSTIASSLICPILTFYALWLLNEARKRGCKRLYFVARDGYLVKAIADSLVHALKIPIETRYLYGSRQAWHLPAITGFSTQNLSWLFEKTRTISVRIVLSRLQITPEAIRDILEFAGWPPSSWDCFLNDKAMKKLESDLLGSEEFRKNVQQLAGQRRALAVEYLEQEGLLGEESSAIVDLGWHGRLQYSLEKLLETKRKVKTIGLYFGLYADSPSLQHLTTASYLEWDLRCPPNGSDIPSLVFLMESFCTAPHGSTVGYRREESGRISPDLRIQTIEPLKQWGVTTVHKVVEEYADNLRNCHLPLYALKWDAKPVMVSILQAFSTNPLPLEAKSWGSFPYEDEQGGVVREKLTAPYELTIESLRIALTFGEERFLPASWNVLWHGAQGYAQSPSASVIRCALALGRAKKKIGHKLRRLIGHFENN